MNSISSYNAAFPASSGFKEAYQSYAELQATRLSVSESRSKDITIFTEEGDKVTISSNQQSQTQVLTYEGFQRQTGSLERPGYSQVRDSLEMFKGELFESESSRNISISVDGDLNEEELKDIKKALKSIDKIMTDLLYSGDMADAAVKSMEIKQLDTIAGLEASYRYEKSVILEQTSLKETTAYSTKDRDLETSPLINSNYLEQLKSLVDELANIIQTSETEPSRFKKPIQELFKGYRNNSDENELLKSHRNSTADWIEKELIKKLTSLSENFKIVSESSPAE